MRSTGFVAVMLLVTCATLAGAKDVSTDKLQIKDNANPAKRQVSVQSKDPGVQMSEVDDPGAGGASVHVYSATDDFCLVLQGGTAWKNAKGSWKYADKLTKNSAQVKDGKLAVKVKSGVTYTLADNTTQGAVNVQVQFGGNGVRYCMRCSSPKKDTAAIFSATKCVAAPCDPEPSSCLPPGTTTTTTTLPCNPPMAVLKGALPASLGRFTYNLQLGLPGANSACAASFPGTHPCTYTELQSAAAACDLPGLKDTMGATVTSFWAIDPTAAALQQCNDDNLGGSGLNWEYGTAHTMSRGQKVALDNPSGTLGPLQTSQQCSGSLNSVGCCQ